MGPAFAPSGSAPAMELTRVWGWGYPPASSAAIRRSGGSASSGQSAGSGGHHACSSCSASMTRPETVADPRQAHQHHHPGRDPDQRLDGQPLGHQRPLLVQLARQRLDRVLAHLDRAAGAQRPAPGPGGHPRGAAAGQPAALGVAHHAQRRERVGGVVAQAQRPPHRLAHQVHPVVADRQRRHPRGHPVVGRRAALGQLGQRRRRPPRRPRARPRRARRPSARSRPPAPTGRAPESRAPGVTPSAAPCGSSRIRITRAGTPPTTALAGTSWVTTAFVPITALSPTVTPRRMQAP